MRGPGPPSAEPPPRMGHAGARAACLLHGGEMTTREGFQHPGRKPVCVVLAGCFAFCTSLRGFP